MSEDQALLDRISKLAGHINLHKAHPDALQESKIENVQPRSRDPTSAVLTNSASWSPSRPAPYNKGGERAGRVAPNPHRHRTLVLNNKAGNVSSESILSGAKRYESESSRKGQTPVNNWVTKRDRHMQLINSSIYEKETQQRNKGIEETRKQKMIRRDQREKRKIQRHLQTLHPPRIGATSASIAHEMTIQGLRFHVLDGGSKLARIRQEIDSASATPKHANIGGVSFLRSKNGNMYRSGVVKARKGKITSRKINESCKRFTATGQCMKGPLCPFIHDPTKVAMCRDFLQTGKCSAGDSCDLSHDPKPERVPACLHFLRGKCSNNACRYAHVRVNASAPVCRPFATLGYCSIGAQCLERHVHECPDYANVGLCRNNKCRLPHIDRAGQIKKHTANLTGADARGSEDSDLSSDDDNQVDSDDVDSDGMEEDMMDLSDETASHALSQQQDYVHF